ncbi:MAG: hypothetical protein JWP19_1216 [Rhodoglobus sp.]|nr:hypothetical protein [Rhodoglobus sp.]
MTQNPAVPVRLWSALVVRGALEGAILPAFVEETGIVVESVFDPTTVLMQRIADGDRPDVIVSTTGSLDLLPSGVLASGAIAPLVRTGIGIGVAEGAVEPDISTVERLTASLLAARSVAYSRAGQSGIYFASLIEELGIADEVNAKATVLEKGFTGEAVIDGRADIAVQQVSELRFVPGITVVGSLPEAVQRYTDFSVALAAGSSDLEPARRLLAHLTSEASRGSYIAEGLVVPQFPGEA